MFALVIVQSWMFVVLRGLRLRPQLRPGRVDRGRGEQGQTTAEYALVMIGAAALALLLIAWATRTDRVGQLFDFVMEHITGRVG